MNEAGGKANIQIVVAREQTYGVLPQPFWHVPLRRGSALLHNAHNGEGILYSYSAIRRAGIGLDDLGTFYGLFNKHQDKEAVWERVRVQEFNSRPTRQHALFLFDDESLAKEACTKWFANEDRVVVEARLVIGSNVHRADAKWLDAQQEKWMESAANYWRGDMTSSPYPEIIVEGAVYFPGWKEQPFGFFAGMR
jgi:hypothetical protein